jgi:Fe2+ or Zn2+ uptake regulation protein
MEIRYRILQTLALMVQEAPHPTQYQCIPREIILRSTFDWAEIYTSLLALQEEGLVKLFDADGIRFSVNQQGLNFANSMEEDPTMKILGYNSLL